MNRDPDASFTFESLTVNRVLASCWIVNREPTAIASPTLLHCVLRWRLVSFSVKRPCFDHVLETGLAFPSCAVSAAKNILYCCGVISTSRLLYSPNKYVTTLHKAFVLFRQQEGTGPMQWRHVDHPQIKATVPRSSAKTERRFTGDLCY